MRLGGFEEEGGGVRLRGFVKNNLSISPFSSCLFRFFTFSLYLSLCSKNHNLPDDFKGLVMEIIRFYSCL